MGSVLLRVFLFPGEKMCAALGVSDPESKMMLRTLVDMLFWNMVAVIIVVLIFG